MKFDSAQFENLELDNIGQWPAAPKLVLSIFLFVFVLAIGFVFLIQDKIDEHERYVQEEVQLRLQFQTKYHLAANLEKFQLQMIEAEAMFANQVKRLPESHETPGLLDDITFVGTTSGLNFYKINWQPEISKEIYVELPIDIEVVGNYHEFGEFVSKIAGLPRIVTLHDFVIESDVQSPGLLKLNLQAKTYRYNDGR